MVLKVFINPIMKSWSFQTPSQIWVQNFTILAKNKSLSNCTKIQKKRVKIQQNRLKKKKKLQNNNSDLSPKFTVALYIIKYFTNYSFMFLLRFRMFKSSCCCFPTWFDLRVVPLLVLNPSPVLKDSSRFDNNPLRSAASFRTFRFGTNCFGESFFFHKHI